MNGTLKKMFGIGGKRPGWDRRKAGDAARNAGDWPAADAAYADYLALNPEDGPIWVQRGHAQKESGNLGGAERCYRRAADIDPRQSDPFFHLACLMRSMERNTDAIEFYKRAAALGEKLALGDLDRMGVAIDPRARNDSGLLPWIANETLARILLDAQAARDLHRWKDAEALYLTYLKNRPESSEVVSELEAVRQAGRR